MRIFWIGIALYLSVGHVQGMEEEEAGVELKVLRVEELSAEDPMYVARHVVRSVVQDTLEKYVNKFENEKLKEWGVLKWQIRDQEYSNTLNEVILTFLKTGEDPVWLGCENSFEGVGEALLKAGIRLCEQDQDKLRLLTPQEQHDKIIIIARAVILPIVYKNVNVYKNHLITGAKNDKAKVMIDEDFVRFSEDIQAEAYREKLDQDIVAYLLNDKDPYYFNCHFSFKGIKETLKKDEIVLNNQTRTLRFLTEREKRVKNEEYTKLINEFAFIEN
jgi:hypothetical protein